MLRRTKILATLGPATDAPKILEAIIRAGVDVVRLNFSHGTEEEHRTRVKLVRECATSQGRAIGVLADLQGPKIRTHRFRAGRVFLQEGAPFILDADMAPDAGTVEGVGITYKALPQDVQVGDTLLLDDGRLVLVVEDVIGPQVICRVWVGGELSDKKGINRQGGGLSAPALTHKDREDIRTAAELGVDYLAISFPRSADDVLEARALLRAAGGHGAIVSKIERAEALNDLEGIVKASDAVMIARGDLGVEIGDAELPGVQKRIIRMARDMNRVSITATQMMESMIKNPTPTRAEVLDIANAVMDGTDAVMLSAETAAGSYPVQAVQAMARICLGAERQRETQRSKHRIDSHFESVGEAIAMATMYTANHMDVSAIVALTETGFTPLLMSRIRSGIPIFSLTRHEATRRRVTLYRGVYPVRFDVKYDNPTLVIQDAIDTMLNRGAVREGDLVILTKGDFTGISGRTNVMKIIRVGDPIFPEEQE
ncbi:MAG: pyruvate kinase [Gammaproteobacteria bacterium]|nr:pyruvate kinase [Gammaproteobacteria bacterium]